MRVLVTGGAGYIGSHTCKELALAGHEPVVYDNLSMGHEWAVKWGPLVVGDLADTANICRTLREHAIEAVIHFAASAHVGESMRNPMAYFRNNVSGTISLLDAMLECDVLPIVFSSSCAVYGVLSSVPVNESHPTRPINPYGESKLAAEKLLRWLGEIKGLRWMALRYFNAAGADPEGEIGESHDPETHIMPLALRAANPAGAAVLKVLGEDYPTADGTAVRDYIHVADLARAHVKALDKSARDTVNEAVNLGTGCGISIMQLIGVVEEVTGHRVRIVNAPRRPGDPPELVAEATKASHVLGWAPNRSDIRTIVHDAWQWELRRHG